MRGTVRAVIEEVIRTETVIGSGATQEDPVRRVIQYWGKDGRFICEEDPITKKAKPERPDKPVQHQ